MWSWCDHILKPLTNISGKQEVQVWKGSQDQAFKKKSCHIFTVASDYQSGSTTVQDRKPIASCQCLIRSKTQGLLSKEDIEAMIEDSFLFYSTLSDINFCKRTAVRSGCSASRCKWPNFLQAGLRSDSQSLFTGITTWGNHFLVSQIPKKEVLNWVTNELHGMSYVCNSVQVTGAIPNWQFKETPHLLVSFGESKQTK